MTTYQKVKIELEKQIGDKHISAEQESKLNSLKKLDELDAFSRKLKISIPAFLLEEDNC